MPVNNEGVLCESASHCVLCRSTGQPLYEGLRDRLFDAPGEWSLIQCSDPSCALIWCSPRPLPDQIGKLYRNYYTHSAADGAPVNAPSQSGFLKQVLGYVMFWRAPMFLTASLHLEGLKPGRLLEIGCGNGHFLAQAARSGWSAFGIDFDADAIASANKRPGVTAHIGELKDCAFAPSSFDAVVMNNVIEHVWNPIETMAECRRILKKSGRLVIITPNAASDGHGIFGKNWRGLEPPRHLFIYNVRALNRLSQMSGFERSFVFSSSGGATGVQMIESSLRAANDLTLAYSSLRVRWIVKRETIKTYLGRNCGEWCVAIC